MWLRTVFISSNISRITEHFAKRCRIGSAKRGGDCREVEGGWETRTMGDIDIWLQNDDIPQSYQSMRELGFYTVNKASRPSDTTDDV